MIDHMTVYTTIDIYDPDNDMVLARVAPKAVFSWTPRQHRTIQDTTGGVSLPGKRIVIPKDWLYEHYIKRGLSLKSCGDLYGCSSSNVRNYLRAHNLPLRDYREASNHPEKVDIPKTFLEEQYVRNERSITELAEIFGCSYVTVWNRLHEHGLSGSPIVRSGEKHPRWKGGVRFGAYCPKFNYHLKEAVREKFGRRCYVCGEPENGRRLAVHHIDYNKNTLCNGRTWPLLPLCHSHHGKTNANRWYWFSLLINYWAMDAGINFNLGGDLYENPPRL